jgi:hypothetical protein
MQNFEGFCTFSGYIKSGSKVIFLVLKGPAADAMDAPQPEGFFCNPVTIIIIIVVVTIIIICPFPSNGAAVE